MLAESVVEEKICKFQIVGMYGKQNTKGELIKPKNVLFKIFSCLFYLYPKHTFTETFLTLSGCYIFQKSH